MNCSQVAAANQEYHGRTTRGGGAGRGEGWSTEFDKMWRRTPVETPAEEPGRAPDNRAAGHDGRRVWTPENQRIQNECETCASRRAESGSAETGPSDAEETDSAAESGRAYSLVSLRDPWAEDHPLREKCDAFLQLFRETYAAVLEEKGLMPENGQYDPAILPDDEMADIKARMIDRLNDNPEALALMSDLYIDLAETGRVQAAVAEAEETQAEAAGIEARFLPLSLGRPVYWLLHLTDEGALEKLGARDRLLAKMAEFTAEECAGENITTSMLTRDPETGDLTEEARAIVDRIYQRLVDDPESKALMDELGFTGRSRHGWPAPDENYPAAEGWVTKEITMIAMEPHLFEGLDNIKLFFQAADLGLPQYSGRLYFNPNPIGMDEDRQALQDKLTAIQKDVLGEMNLLYASLRDGLTGELTEEALAARDLIQQRFMDDPEVRDLLQKAGLTEVNDRGWPARDYTADWNKTVEGQRRSVTEETGGQAAAAEGELSDEPAANYLGEVIPLSDIRHGRRMVILGVMSCLLPDRSKADTIYDQEYMAMVKKAQDEVLLEYGIDPETFGDPKMMSDPAYLNKLDAVLGNMSRKIYEKISADPRGRNLMKKLEINVPPSVTRQWEADRAAEEAQAAANAEKTSSETTSEMLARLTRQMLKEFMDNILTNQEADEKEFSLLTEENV